MRSPPRSSDASTPRRTIALQVKSAYLVIAQATLTYKFAKEVAATQETTLKRAQDRYRGGASNERRPSAYRSPEARSDQAVDQAISQLRTARIALAFLLGVRGEIPDFDVDTKVLDYGVPSGLRDTSETGLLRTAFDTRPDLISLGYTKQQAEAQIALVKRQRWPGLTFGANYAWGGYGRQLDERSDPSADRLVQHFGAASDLLQPARRAAPSVRAVRSGLAQPGEADRAGRERTSRPPSPRSAPRRSWSSGWKGRAAKAAVSFRAHVAPSRSSARNTRRAPRASPTTSTRFRTYIATKNEYFNDLSNYWTAVFQLEAAVSRDSAMKSVTKWSAVAILAALAWPGVASAANDAGV